MISHSSVLILFCLSLTLASEASASSPVTPTEETLRQLIDQIDENEQLNRAKREEMKKKEQTIACNWHLIRSYEVCTQLYQNKPQEQLACVQKAKNNAARCLIDKEK